MIRLTLLAVLAVLFGLPGIAAATPADPSAAEAQLTWRLGFGGGRIETGYALNVGFRSGALDGLPAELLQLDVSSRGAHARLAGVPLARRSGRVQQTDADAAFDEPANRPWYSRQWVWWTIGGIAATVALSGASFGASDEGGDDIVINSNPTANNGVCTGGGNVGPEEVPESCTPETEGGTVVGVDDDGNVCVVDGFGNPADVCAPTGFVGRLGSRFVGRAQGAALDAGTGGMGDLVARD